MIADNLPGLWLEPQSHCSGTALRTTQLSMATDTNLDLGTSDIFQLQTGCCSALLQQEAMHLPRQVDCQYDWLAGRAGSRVTHHGM